MPPHTHQPMRAMMEAALTFYYQESEEAKEVVREIWELMDAGRPDEAIEKLRLAIEGRVLVKKE